MYNNYLDVLPKVFRLVGFSSCLLTVILLLIRCQSTQPDTSESETSYTDHKIFYLGFIITLPSKWGIFEKIDHINIANMVNILAVPEDMHGEYGNGFVGSIYLSSVEEMIQIYTNMYDRIPNNEQIQEIDILSLNAFAPMSTLFTHSEFESLRQQFNIIFDISLSSNAEYLSYDNTIVISAKHIETQKYVFLLLRTLNDTQTIVCIFNNTSKFIDENWIPQWVRSVNTIQLIQ